MKFNFNPLLVATHTNFNYYVTTPTVSNTCMCGNCSFMYFTFYQKDESQIQLAEISNKMGEHTCPVNVKLLFFTSKS